VTAGAPLPQPGHPCFLKRHREATESSTERHFQRCKAAGKIAACGEEQAPAPAAAALPHGPGRAEPTGFEPAERLLCDAKLTESYERFDLVRKEAGYRRFRHAGG
jgi:hypothetical protein